MPEPIVVLHVSDLHAKEETKRQLEQRINALFADLTKLGLKIDVALFTGDLAFSGKTDQYELADTMLINPLSTRLHIKKEHVFIIPGNHDVDRNAVDKYTEIGLRQDLTDTAKAETVIDVPGNGYVRLKSYYEYIEKKQGHKPSHYRTRVLSIRGIKIGFACFDTAWRCYGDEDEGHLFLTENQTYQAANELANCNLRFALMHHPHSWLHPSEQNKVIPDLKRGFDVIVRGHLHQSYSVAEVTPSSECLEFAVPALCDGRSPDVGYNLYIIDFQDKTLTVKYRKYVERRGVFAQDIDHADNGEHVFKLPITDLIRYGQSMLTQQIISLSEDYKDQVSASLATLQPSSSPVYVNPKLSKVVYGGKNEKQYACNKDMSDFLQKSSLILGHHESGKTILLKQMAANFNQSSGEEHLHRAAIYIDFDKVRVNDIEATITRAIERTTLTTGTEVKPSNFILLVDNIPSHSNEHFDEIYRLERQRSEWHIIGIFSNKLLFDIIRAKTEFETWNFFKLDYWGPSRIREFIKGFYSSESVDIESAFQFVTNSLRDTDIPASPTVVVLYLTVFRLIGNQVSSLSFVGLLEKFEELRLRGIRNSADNALFNKQLILAQIATRCVASDVESLSRQTVLQIIASYFESKLLPYDAEALISEFVSSTILMDDGNTIGFRFDAFKSFYLARAFRDGIADLESFMDTLYGCICVSDAISIHGGLTRDHIRSAKRLLELIENEIGEATNVTLADLDALALGTFLPSSTEDNSDEIATQDIEEKIDYENMDHEFAVSKERTTTRRAEISTLINPTTRIQKLGIWSYALKGFYNLFRNLENLNGTDKIALFDRILDLHALFTKEIILLFHEIVPGEDIKTFFTYIVTLATQSWMTNNVFNQSLESTIKLTLDNCDNDFKKLLLVMLYADLRLPGYMDMLENYTDNTNSRVAIEMIFMKLRHMMVIHESRRLPTELISVFKQVFRKRQRLNKKKSSEGALSSAFNLIMKETNIQHLTHKVEQD